MGHPKRLRFSSFHVYGQVTVMIRKKSYRPTAFERMQYFYSTAHEPLIHARISVSSPLDEQTLVDAVSASIPYVPLLGCIFSTRLQPRWRDCGFTGQNIVRIRTVSCEEAAKAIQVAMTASISIDSEPQMRITLVRSCAEDVLCVLVNHMVCDGAGLKQYITLLASLYTRLSAGQPLPPAKPTIRSAKYLLSGLHPKRLCNVLLHSYAKLIQPETFHVPLAENKQPPHIVTRQIPGESLNAIKRFARAQGVTINDVILTAYARVLAHLTGERQISLPCPVDLRKYLPNRNTLSISNLTVNYVISVTIDPESPFVETLRVVNQQITTQKRSDECLKSVLLVGIIMHVIPFFLMKKNFSRAFTIPVISYTNFGIMDEQGLLFGESRVTDVFLTGAIKRAPYFQLAVSTFGGAMTLSSDLFGSEHAVAEAKAILEAIAVEMMQEPT